LRETADCNTPNDETKLKISNALKGKRRNIETRLKISIGNKGKHTITPPSWLGKKHSEESKKKISFAMKNRKRTVDDGKILN
jgi:hypothetical protein